MIYIFLAMILYSIGMMFGVAASRNIDTNLAAGITNIVSAIVPLTVAVSLISKKNIANHKFGAIMAVLCGVAIALFVMSINKAYAVNKVGIVAPIVFGGAIVMSTLLSTVIFKEKINFTEGIGLAVLTVGFGIIIYARAVAK